MGGLLQFIQIAIIVAVPVVFAITVHEAAHGWVASKLGDQTARLQGRLTLNPLKHIDPIGTVIVPLVLLYLGGLVFGWARPVPVDWRNLRNPRRDMAWVAAAGPMANLVMAIFWALLIKTIAILGLSLEGPVLAMRLMCIMGVLMNTLLMALNLFPVPPLDGSRVASALMPVRWAYLYNRLEPFGLFIILALLISGLLWGVLDPVMTAFLNVVGLLLGLDLVSMVNALA